MQFRRLISFFNISQWYPDMASASFRMTAGESGATSPSIAPGFITYPSLLSKALPRP